MHGDEQLLHELDLVLLGPAGEVVHADVSLLQIPDDPSFSQYKNNIQF